MPARCRGAPVDRGRLTHRRPALTATLGRWVGLGWPALVAPAVAFAVRLSAGTAGWFNDFHAYWLAGRLVASGRDPFDVGALAALGQQAGLHFVTGGGYSYPLPFAVLMVPLAALPFGVAAGLFTLASAAALVLVTGWWLARFHAAARPGRARAVAALVGLYPPVAGSLFVGQVNLLVLALLAPAVAFAALRPGVAGLLAGAAGIVKLVPLVLALPPALVPRWRGMAGIAAGAGAPLLAASLLAPAAGSGAGTLQSLFAPDPYWSNQSLNGVVSRLLLPSDRTAPIVAVGWLAEPAAIAVAAGLALAVVALLARGRAALAADATALELATALVLSAAVLGAPKDSFWNHALALPALGLLGARVAPDLAVGRLDRLDRALLAGGYALALLAAAVGALTGFEAGPLAPVRTLLGSSGAASLGLFVLAIARHARRAMRAAAVETPPQRPAAILRR